MDLIQAIYTIFHIFNELLQYNNDANNFGDEITDAGNDAVILNFPKYPIARNPDGSEINRDGGQIISNVT